MRTPAKRFQRFVKQYKWNRVFLKYFKKSILYVLIPLIVLCSVVFFSVIRSDEGSLIDHQNRIFLQTAAILETVFNDVDNNHLVLSGSHEILNYCTLSDDTPFDQFYSVTFRSRDLLSNIKLTSQYIENVHIYNPKRSYVLSSLNGNSLENFHLTRWYEIFQQTGASRFLYYSQSSLPNVYSDSVMVVRGLEQEGYLYGMALFDINVITIEEILKQQEYSQLQLLYDASGNIFYATDAALIAKNIEEIESDLSFSQIDNYSKDGNILTQKANINGLYTYICQTNLMPMRNIDYYVAILLVLIVFALLVAFALSYYLSMQFYRSVVEIAATLRNGEVDNSDSNRENYNELLYLNRHIVSQFINAENLERRLAEQVNMLKQAQITALQTQLNPHFISNTLNSINVMVLRITKKDCDASQAIIKLSSMLRSALDTKQYIVSLQKEIEYAKTYIDLQRFRFRYNLDVLWNIDESLLQHNVIKFIFQPLIENAFEHGFNNMGVDDLKTLEISAKPVDNNIIILISNNGASVAPEDLAILQNKLRNPDLPSQQGIGLTNVHFRIRLVYGNPYGCSISSGQGKTTVTITLPLGDVPL